MSDEPAADARRTLQLYFFGPGVGESIVLRLPCGQWGVVDCYAPVGVAAEHDIIEFLRRRGVERLAFFCWTHPHADHFRGAHRLLEAYRGRIDRLWRYGGFSGKELHTRIALAAKVKAKIEQDPEADALAGDFMRLLQEISKAKVGMSDENYRLVLAPASLLESEAYEIRALRPGSALVEGIQDRVLARNIDPQRGYLLLCEEEGTVLNSLSVVLSIRFGTARVVLLGDAEGADEDIHAHAEEFTALKIAHHGSCNGYGVNVLGTAAKASAKAVAMGVITPYNRSRLPRDEMVTHYKAIARTLLVTAPPQAVRLRKIVAGMRNPRLAHDPKARWHGVEVFDTGEVRRMPESAFEEVAAQG
ncbi:MAG: hypothetical protein INR62_00650 [Rhodospirillales bacterium]|nr:hypothetical protein [Acetobacter sp.]